ncbi:hypothetical protein ACIBF5_03210 [Micromonospora sp. NPDC050417]|uniref:hypothetical protein n=1 Tax=Micromonospora sp. NPDC050417 TaxID=3364280 RepID=UPI0037943B12
MSQDHPIPRQDVRSDGVAVVEWGDQAEPTRAQGRGDLLARLARDARLLPVLGGIGAVAAFASLVGEWTIVEVPGFGADGGPTGRAPAGVAQLDGFGVAYLFGLFGVVCCLALVLFGSSRVRRDVRILGLALTGGVLAVLIAATLTLDDIARLGLFMTDPALSIRYGRGLTAAYVGIGFLGLALVLAGRRTRPDPAPRTPTTPASDEPESTEANTEESMFSWRRQQSSAASGDELEAQPRDLTVGPTAPFATPDTPEGR